MEGEGEGEGGDGQVNLQLLQQDIITRKNTLLFTSGVQERKPFVLEETSEQSLLCQGEKCKGSSSERNINLITWY